VSVGVLDTSVVIDLALGIELAVPEEATISVVTLCELHHGVLYADDKHRPGRLATLVWRRTTVACLLSPEEAVADRARTTC
jgi:predicted nucleic acid-binding protein